MAIFNFGNKEKEDDSILTEGAKPKLVDGNESEEIKINERPRICCLDIDENTIDRLKKSVTNVFDGTLGSKIRVQNKQQYQQHNILLNNVFPDNLHEFDIIIADLHNFDIIDWKVEDHIRENLTGNSSTYISSHYPQTLFDPRPFSAYLLNDDLNKINRQFLVLVFSTGNYKIEYQLKSISSNDNYYQGDKSFTKNIYDFWGNVPLSENLYGKEISIENLGNTQLVSLLNKYKNEAFYNQTFRHPTNWKGEEHIKDNKFIPMMTNSRGDIISYANASPKNEGVLFVFPQIQDKTNFLLEFLSDVAPTMFPKVFPFSSTFKWKENQNYWLPNHSDLLTKKEKVQQEFEEKIKNINSEIEKNSSDLSFLHDLITETDDLLVKAIIKFLKWLDFENVRFVDETKSSINEEDIQVDLPDGGLLIVECKGIGGTSTDSDCSQISKIKHRRCKQRNTFDVFALYVVNHQRFLPPLKRKNPPFTEHQIQDATNDERGLLTTWQLFNLYFDIENRIITKEEARESLLNFGLVEFKPNNLQLIDNPTEIFKKGEVCIVNLSENVNLNVNETIYVEKNNKFQLAKILEIKKDGENLTQATEGEFGLKLNNKVQKKSTLWKKVKK
ncbi:MAG: hypothetical protein M3405_11620 [Acidobacteriota bacterium]|jgi:hypothetical protein|nr:hypothetical protein [Acidobacteriota bacterium]